ncbi:MAG: hypothetical protein C4586_08650 [Anaerolineaceae bacterium]|nr:MAG: hypothetical protein C4586_08650 [Anaerolineaceae bacterium]
MGMPDRTVDPNGIEEDDAYMTIFEEARKEKMADMDVWVAWKMGLAAYQQARKLDVKFPHDTPEPIDTPDHMTIADMKVEVADYEPHYNMIDAETIRESSCPACKGPLMYRGFKHGDSYRAFAVCKKCNRADEF